MSKSFADRVLALRAAVPLAVLLAACGDGTGPSAEFEAVEVAASVSHLVDAVDENAATLLAIQLAGYTFYQFGGDMALFPDQGSAARIFSPARAQRVERSAARMAAIPAEMRGQTFVYDAEYDHYVVSSRTGAPANGARFVMYEMDVDDYRPRLPLREIGHLDLIDTGSGSTERMTVRAVRTAGSTLTLADYQVTRSYPSATRTQFTAEGYLGVGTDRVNFDLAEETVEHASGDGETQDYDYSVAVPSEELTVRLDYRVEEDYESSDEASATLTMKHGSNTTVLTFEATEAAIDGTIKYNGRVVVLLSGDPEVPTYKHPDGSRLSAAEADAIEAFIQGSGAYVMMLGYMLAI